MVMKKKVTSTKKPTVTEKPKKELSPALQKALAARRNGTATPRVKKPVPTWQAPADFKPHFLEVLVRVDKDGLLCPDCKVIRYKGRYAPEADERKKFLVNSYDPRTVQGILSRLSMVTFINSVPKRFPAGKTFRLIFRVGKKKDGALTVGYKGISMVTKLKSGRLKEVALEKKDPIYRRFRKAGRLLPAAFSKVLMPPKVERKSKKAEE